MMWRTVPDLPLSGEAGHVMYMMHNPERFAQFATNMYLIFPALRILKKQRWPALKPWKIFSAPYKCPTSLRELGLDLTEEQIHELAFQMQF